MLFNSVFFFFFFILVFVLYWFVFNKNLTAQNILLFVASYFFYACWDWRFLFLLAFSTFLDFFTGQKIHESNSNRTRKTWLIISIVINLSFLCFFKYFNFFSESFAEFLRLFGLKPNVYLINIILPVGISFYTFHGLSYVLDIYYDRIKPTSSVVNYTLFVSFFPLLVAGPIERASHLLPQIERPRVFRYEDGVSGLRQVLWGLFKKVVIADNLAQYANLIFNNSSNFYGATLFLGAIFFSIQIYCDFSGYTDIALGTARLLGFDLLKNFSFPYFSRSVAEFWRRWHISLSSWFKDYLYIPLGGSRNGIYKSIRNTFVIFVVSGFWHGANWTFIVWGLLNALFIMPSIILKSNRNNLDIIAKGQLFPSLKDGFQMLVTFTLVVFMWIFFRAENVDAAIYFIKRIFTSGFNANSIHEVIEFVYWKVGLDKVGLVLFFFIVEWLGRESNFAIERINFKFSQYAKWVFYFFIIIILVLYVGDKDQFIYFQF